MRSPGWFPLLFAASVSLFLPGRACAGAPVHPRLFFGPEDVPAFRAKSGSEPWKGMLAAIEWATENDVAASYDSSIPRPVNFAALHTFRGKGDSGDAWTDRALADCLFLILAPDNEGKPVWAQPGYKSLSRAGRGLQAAITYDLLHNVWKDRRMPERFTIGNGRSFDVPKDIVGTDVNTFLSRALRENADSLVKSGGSGWPGDQKLGNNWNAVRFGVAALSYLACDESRDGWQKNFDTAVRAVVRHKQANLSTDPKANGWNPEGIAYSQYPGWTTYPLVIALRRLEGNDLIRQVPAMERELWATYQGVLPLPRYSRVSGPGEKRRGYGLGLRPDFTDDHPIWDPEGTASLAFALAPKEYLPGLRWMYRRLCGDLGDRTWDSASGNGLYALLFYPADLEEKNPADVWGRTWKDEAFGMFVFRNRFQDSDDFVLQTVAKLRPTFGGHEGRDALSFRLWGLGVPWAVGSGRTTDHRGQTSLFPSDPEENVTPPHGLVPSVPSAFLRRNGDGYVVMNMVLSDTGVSEHTRRIVADYSGESGAPAFFLISDSSENGRFWRWNTPDFNRITTGPNRFTITSPGGHRLDATILWPASGVTPRTGGFKRGSPFAYGEINYDPAGGAKGTGGCTTQNQWVDFPSEDGQFLVAVTVVPKGADVPAVSAEGQGVSQTIRAGKRVITLRGDEIQVDGWTKPVLTIEKPVSGRPILASEGPLEASGTARDPDGIQRVEVSVDGQSPKTAEIRKGDAWFASFPDVTPGTHTLSVRAIDRVADEASSDLTFQVNKTRPPEIAWDESSRDTVLKPGSDLELQGTLRDPEERPITVELRTAAGVLGSATVEGGRFSFLWKSVPIGDHEVTARAVDADQDMSDSLPIHVRVPFPVGEGNASEATRLWVGEAGSFPSPLSPLPRTGLHPQPSGTQRWAITDADGKPALRVRETERWDFANRHLWIRGSEKVKNWRLEWSMKMDSPLEARPGAFVHFGSGIEGPLTMDFRPVESVRFRDASKRTANTTRLWYHDTNGNRPEIGWTVTAHTEKDAGFPGQPGNTSAGIPDQNWHRYKMERSGRTLKVWCDGRLILEAENPWIASSGPVGFANDRLVGDRFSIRDISFNPL